MDHTSTTRIKYASICHVLHIVLMFSLVRSDVLLCDMLFSTYCEMGADTGIMKVAHSRTTQTTTGRRLCLI